MSFELPELQRPGGSQYGVRDRIAANVDRAVQQVCGPGERFLWEIGYPLQQAVQMTPAGPQAVTQISAWLILTGPSVMIGRNSVISGMACDLRAMTDNPEMAVEIVRKLAQNIRDENARQLQGGIN